MAVVVGVQLALGLEFPIPLTGTWWLTRVPWVLATVAVIAVLCLIVPRIERFWPDERTRSMPLWAAVACTAALVASVGWVLTQGYLTPGTGIAIAVLAAAIVWLTRGGPGQARGERPAPVVADRSATGAQA